MSKTIDEKIVSMQFDNRNFETNVKTTMSTLDRLKQSLRFDGAAKSFSDVSAAAGKVDMSPLSTGLDTVQAKFSAMEVVGVTALANITNSAVNAGKNLVKSMSIDQVTAGMSKYEQKTASVQTIMNATGKSIDEVNQYLEKLMWFSDETSYGFTDMTAALGQMTSSGGDIDKLIPLITGVANATAYAGKGAAEFSRVMYNLNQSYGAGYLQMMDWKSLELAGVGSKQLKQTIIDTAEELGKIKKGEVTLANFATTLKDKWADTEVMEKAFGKFGEFSDAVHEMVQSGEVETASEAIEKLSGKHSELSEKAFKSAQEAKSFTEAIDATKDAVSSGWMRTFEIIFGNYEQAKVLWTDLANTLWDVFASGGESRNAWLEEALSYSPLDKLAEKLEKITGVTDKVSKALKDYEEIVNRVIRGDFGNGQGRFDKLTEAGYDWAHTQNLVNEKLGCSKRYATDLTEAQKEQTKQTIELSDAKLKEAGLTEEEIKLYRELEAESKKTGKSIGELIEEMDKADGRTLLIGGFKNIGSGLLGILYAIKEAFAEIFPPMTAFQLYKLIEGFNKLTQCLRLTDAESGELNENGEKLKRTLKGIFAALDIVLTVVGGPIKIAFKALVGVLKAFDLNVLDVTAGIGDAIVRFRDWVDSVLDFEKIFEHIGTLLKPVINKIKEWIDSFKQLPVVQEGLNKIKDTFSGGFGVDTLVNVFNGLWSVLQSVASGIKRCYDEFMKIPAVQNGMKSVANIFSKVFTSITNGIKGIKLNSVTDSISKFFDAIKEWVSGLGDTGKNGDHLISGLGESLKNGIQVVVSAITEICTAIYNTFTNFFDINSPSKVFMTLGKFCIAGLVAGLLFAKNDTSSAMSEIGGTLLGSVKTAVGTVSDFMKNIDWTKIMAIGGAVAMFTTVNKMIGMMDTWGKSIGEFGKAFSGFGSMCTSAGKLMDAVTGKIAPKKTKFTEIADNVLKFAGAIAILAGSIFLLAQLDYGKLWSAVGAILALALIITGLTFAVSKMDSVGDVNFGKIALALIGLSAALFIMASAIKKLDFINQFNVIPILSTVAVMFAGLTVLMIAIGKCIKGELAANLDKAGWTIFKIASAVLLLTYVVKAVSKLDVAELYNGVEALALFGIFIAGFAVISNLGGKSIDGLGKTVLQLSIAMIVLIGVIKLVSKLDPAEFAKGYTCMVLLGGLITGLIAATKLAGGQNLNKIGSILMSMGVAMGLMSITMKILASMSPGELFKGILCIAALGGIITGLVAATRLAGDKELKRIGITLLSMSISIAMLGAISILLGLMDLSLLAKGVTAVAILGSIVALMIWATRGAVDVQKSIVAMTTAIGIMAAAVFVLSLIPFEKLAPAVAGMGVLMGIFALMMKTAASAKGAIGTIILLTVVVAALAGIIWGLSKLGVENVLPTVTALSLLMTSMSVALAVCSKITADPTAALGGILSMAAMAGVLYLFCVALQALPNMSGREGDIIAIVAVMAAMTILLAALIGIGALFGATAGLGLLGLLGMIFMLAVFKDFAKAIDELPDLSSKITTVALITQLMTAMTGMLVVASLLGPLALVGIVAINGLLGVMTVIGILATSVGALVSKFPQLETFLDTGIPILEKLAHGLGSIIGNFVGGLASGALASLPEIGTYLSMFMANTMPFITGVKMVDKSVLTGVGILVGTIAALTVADVIHGIRSFGNDGESFARLGTELSNFMTNASTFIEGAAKLDNTVMTGVKNLAEAILILTAADLVEGFTSFLFGESDFSTFGTSIGLLGEGINAFATSMGTLTPDQLTSIETGAKAIKTFAEAAKTIPNSGGIAGFFAGENNLGNFATEIGNTGSALATFVTNIGTFTQAELDTVKYGAQAVAEFAKAADQIPNSGGESAFWAGENSLGNFAVEIGNTGLALATFVTNIGTFGQAQLDAVKFGAQAVVEFAKAATQIPNSGGVSGFFAGNNDLGKFGEMLPNLGKNLKDFVTNAGDIQTGKIDDVVKVLNALIRFANLEIVKSGNDLNSFGGNLQGFGKKIKSFCEQMANVTSESISAAVANIKALSDGFSQLSNADAEPLVAFSNALDTVSTKGVSNIINGFNEGKEPVVKAITALITTAAGAIKTEDNYKKFVSAGKSCVEGFAEGITNNIYMGEDAAWDLGKAALQAAKEAINSNSPSKEFYKIGTYGGQGFVNALIDYEDKSYKAGYSMASVATKGLRNAISRVKDAIDSDIDTQPTIRPVLDLSDVAAGAGAIGGMLGMRPSVGVLANVGEIGYMMNNRQNGTNDVLSAIKDLGRKLSNATGDTYQINGVTYDDGSNITDAVKTIVRAARVERRI